MNKPLTITISGRSGAGKTLLANILGRQLLSAGHTISIQDGASTRDNIIDTCSALGTGHSFSQMQPASIIIRTEMENADGEQPFEIQFADGHKRVVRERNFSRASTLAAYQRMQEGESLHIALGIDGGRLLK